MTEPTGADLLAAALLANDIDTVFTLPGLQLDPVFDALAKRRTEFSIYHVRHELADDPVQYATALSLVSLGAA